MTKRIEVPKFTDKLKSVSLGKSLLWQANGVELRCHADNLMNPDGRKTLTLQMIANGFVVAIVEIVFRRRLDLAECVLRANTSGHFEPRVGTYRIV